MKKLFVIICLFLLTFALVNSVYAGNITQKDVDNIVNKNLKESNIPGFSIAVLLSNGDKIERSYGYANLEYKIPVDKDSVFEIGSLSKTFTAIGILILQQEGKLSVNDKLSKYFPQYQYGNDMTIKNLLQHTSGLHELTDIEPFAGNRAKSWTPYQLTNMILAEPLDFMPGQKSIYSNSNFILLGVIIEKVSGMSFADFLKERICTPLGMTHTRLGSNSDIILKRVSGYEFTSDGLKNAESEALSGPYSSGAVLSTPSDFIKLAKVFKAEALLNKKSVEEMTSPARLNNGSIAEGKIFTYGYGLDMLKTTYFIPAKTGGIAGFNAFFVYEPKSGVMIMATANLENSLSTIFNICTELMSQIKK